jgi:hypothetical protein
MAWKVAFVCISMMLKNVLLMHSFNGSSSIVRETRWRDVAVKLPAVDGLNIHLEQRHDRVNRTTALRHVNGACTGSQVVLSFLHRRGGEQGFIQNRLEIFANLYVVIQEPPAEANTIPNFGFYAAAPELQSDFLSS